MKKLLHSLGLVAASLSMLMAVSTLSSCEKSEDTIPVAAGDIVGSNYLPDAPGAKIVLSVAPIEGALTYQWYQTTVTGGTAKIQHSASRDLTVTEVGSYAVAGVNKNGDEGPRSAEHIVELDPKPAAAGEIRVSREMESLGVWILRTDAIERATTYKWYRNGVAYDEDDNTEAMVPTTDEGVYTVVGVNSFGEGAPSAPVTLTLGGGPVGSVDPAIYLNQFAWDGLVFSIDPTSVEYNVNGEGLLTLSMFDGSVDQGTFNNAFTITMPRSQFGGQPIDLNVYGGVEYFSSKDNFDSGTEESFIDYNGGEGYMLFDEETKDLELDIHFVLVSDYGTDLHFRAKFKGNVDGYEKDEPATEYSVASVDELVGAWYVSEAQANMSEGVITVKGYTIEVVKTGDNTVEIRNMNGLRGGIMNPGDTYTRFAVSATLAGGKLEFGVRPEITPSWQPGVTTHMLPVPNGSDIGSVNGIKALWNDVAFPPQAFLKTDSGKLKLDMNIGNVELPVGVDMDFVADYVVAGKAPSTVYGGEVAMIVCNTEWIKMDASEAARMARASTRAIPAPMAKFAAWQPVSVWNYMSR